MAKPAPKPITAALPPVDETADETPATEQRFRVVLAFVDRDTVDERVLHAIDWRELPLPFSTVDTTSAYGGHDGAWVSGRIDEIEMRDDVAFGWGTYLGNEDGQRAVMLAQDAALTGVSIDFTGDGKFECRKEIEVEDPYFGDSYTLCEEGVYAYDLATIAMATQCQIPAFAGSRLELIPADETPEEASKAEAALIKQATSAMGPVVEQAAALTASVAAPEAPEVPPAAWFTDPALGHLTGVTVNADGRVFGHLAGWGTCHIGIEGACVTPPVSRASYAYFEQGTILVDTDGTHDEVPCGHITMNTDHAGEYLGAAEATAHYERTGWVAADVRVGEDAHGIWVAGALRRGLDADQVREFRAAPLSGDWRPVRGGLELVAAMACNTPGFPLVASGIRTHAGGRDEQRSLIVRSPKRDQTRAGLLEAVVARQAKTLGRLEGQVAALMASGGADQVWAALDQQVHLT